MVNHKDYIQQFLEVRLLFREAERCIRFAIPIFIIFFGGRLRSYRGIYHFVKILLNILIDLIPISIHQGSIVYFFLKSYELLRPFIHLSRISLQQP